MKLDGGHTELLAIAMSESYGLAETGVEVPERSSKTLLAMCKSFNKITAGQNGQLLNA